jgi:hypothetical protein
MSNLPPQSSTSATPGASRWLVTTGTRRRGALLDVAGQVQLVEDGLVEDDRAAGDGAALREDARGDEPLEGDVGDAAGDAGRLLQRQVDGELVPETVGDAEREGPGRRRWWASESSRAQ